jgi:hypothetical protein
LALAVLPKGSTDQQQKVDKISFIISSRFLPSSNGQDSLSLPSSTAANHPLIHQPTSPQASSVHPVHTLKLNETHKKMDAVPAANSWILCTDFNQAFTDFWD